MEKYLAQDHMIFIIRECDLSDHLSQLSDCAKPVRLSRFVLFAKGYREKLHKKERLILERSLAGSHVMEGGGCSTRIEHNVIKISN